MRASSPQATGGRRGTLVAVCTAAAVTITATPAAAAQPPAADHHHEGAAASATASAASTRGWRTLRNRSGFRVRAPKGYRLRVRRGAYEITGPRAKVSLVGIRTSDSVESVAEGLLGVTPPGAAGARQLSLRVALKGGKRAQVVFNRAPKGVSVVTVTPRGSSKTVSSTERRRLGTIVRSARGIRLTTLQKRTSQVQEAPIPLKPFTLADGTAKADVPDGAGWSAGGQQGTVEGGHPELGSFAFGVAVPYLVPQAFCFSPCSLLRSPFLPAAAAVEQAWPQFLAAGGAPATDVRVVAQVPGSAGVLGPGMDSGMFQFTATSGGRAVVGYIVAGTFQVSPENWYLYFSYVAAFQGVSGAVGDALMRTWQTWDPSADQARRQRLTFIAQQETLNIIQQATEYRRRVFEKTNYNWVQLIRGENPVLAPVDPNVIGSGGQTLVRDPDGKLFDLSGNQFKEPGSG